jgi:NADPH2:quinone reductase
MKAILVREFGGPEVLKLEEVPTPRPAAGQVLVRVKAQGAGVWVPYGTAYHALRHFADARTGETLLVHGASGGVGTAAVQIARVMGLVVFGTAGTAKGLDLVVREGAHQAFDHGQPRYQDAILEATDGRGVDVILEVLANVNLGADLKLLRQSGRVIVIGSRGDVTITPRDLMSRRASVRAFTLGGISEAEERETLAALANGLENGTLRPVVGKELPLAQAAQAHKDIMAPGALGKIVLVP